MRRSGQAFGIGIAAVVAGLSGCAKIRYPSYYVLTLPAPVVSTDRKPILGSVAVRQFTAPGYLREGPIVYRQSPDELGFYQYDRWAVDPRRAVTNAMIQSLEARGIAQSVDLYDGSLTRACLLTGGIDRLEEVDEGRVVWIEVAVSAQLTSLRTGEVLWQGSSSKRVKLDQRSIPGVVAGLSLEMGDAVGDLVSSMSQRVSAASSARISETGGR